MISDCSGNRLTKPALVYKNLPGELEIDPPTYPSYGHTVLIYQSICLFFRLDTQIITIYSTPPNQKSMRQKKYADKPTYKPNLPKRAPTSSNPPAGTYSTHRAHQSRTLFSALYFKFEVWRWQSMNRALWRCGEALYSRVCVFLLPLTVIEYCPSSNPRSPSLSLSQDLLSFCSVFFHARAEKKRRHSFWESLCDGTLKTEERWATKFYSKSQNVTIHTPTFSL